MTTHSDNTVSSARPIVRRRNNRDADSACGKILLTVPDLRPPADGHKKLVTVETELPTDPGGLPSETPSTMDDWSRHEPPKAYDKLTGAAADSAVDTSDYGEFASEFASAATKPPRETSTIAQQGEAERVSGSNPLTPPSTASSPTTSSPTTSSPTTSSPTTSSPTTSSPTAKSAALEFNWGEFTATAKRQLGTLGTIAAAVIACTLIARAMKQDRTTPGSSLGIAAFETRELNDASDLQGAGPEVLSQNRTDESTSDASLASESTMLSGRMDAPAKAASSELNLTSPNTGATEEVDPFMAFQRQQGTLAGNSAPPTEAGLNPTATQPPVASSYTPNTNPSALSANPAPAASSWPRPVNAADVWPQNPPIDVQYQAPQRPNAWSSSAQTASPVGRQAMVENPFTRPINTQPANLGEQRQNAQVTSNNYPSTSSQLFPQMQQLEVAAKDQPGQGWRNNVSPNDTQNSATRSFDSSPQPNNRSGVIR